jgi:acetoin utilization deacetylase AcuC-like enzyme
VRVSYRDSYFVPLPPGHPFPIAKFRALHGLLLAERLIRPADVIEPREASWSDLLLVHTEDYLRRFGSGTLSRAEERRAGLPWSPALVHRSRVAVQGTLNAALMALEDGVAANLAGGTHHAMPGHAEGFCLFNDVAVALRVLLRSAWIGRAVVIDLDVHQGNGTAHAFADDPRVYTFSMHGAKNYPFRKPPSTRDVGLPDGTGDAAYLELLRAHLPAVLASGPFDLAFYLAGVDVVAGDRYGRLALTPAGLAARDRLVIESVRDAGVPLVLLLSGGYAQSPERTAELHAVSHREAARAFG